MPRIAPSPRQTRPGYEALQRRIEEPLHWAVTLAAVATIPILVALERGDSAWWVMAGDWAVWVVFLVEYMVMGLCAADRRAYLLRSWMSLTVVALSFPALPALLSAVRLVRVARLIRALRVLRLLAVTARGMEAMRRSSGGRGLFYIAILTALMTVSGGALLALLEPDNVHNGFWGGLWWAIVTVTTVGYGDIAPQTAGGRILAVLLMLCGLGLLSTLAASISAVFVGSDEHAEFEELRERLARLEEKLDRVLEERSRGAAAGD
ncbi:MAG: hypothetical protein GC160_07895 [Acidobacteria bacterium]|nr:hypothetical protein [Acidobacteriota bacterium]